MISEFQFTNSEKVLIVDDEELLREVVSLMVAERGGTPVVAASGAEGLAIFSASPNDFEYVFLDFSMPGKNGLETWRAMRAIRPNVKAVLCSGLRITREVEDAWRNKELEFLAKPFLEGDLMGVFQRLREWSEPAT